MTRTATKKAIRFDDETTHRRKQLGQYFTGDPLARLLVALADGQRYESAIDPMCGSGDMLAAVRQASPHVLLSGIEIDPSAYELCDARLNSPATQSEIINSDAFSWAAISRLSRYAFDLVITNPPYVRYQRLAGRAQSDSLPQSEIVRSSLREIARNLPDIPDEDRRIFISIINGYSGLSDLAVPSWILCAMLTARHGRLAMVVPETWLNRDYAGPIQYLLLKLFRILSVVEDSNRAWFEEAQVKTTLVVAERVPAKGNIRAECEGQRYIHVAVPASAITATSVVGALFPNAPNPDQAFAEMLSRSVEPTNSYIPSGLTIAWPNLGEDFANLIAVAKEATWMRECEPVLSERDHLAGSSTVKIPSALVEILGTNPSAAFTTIDDLGGRVGQGLRTGANQFFYCDLIRETTDSCTVAPGRIFNLFPITVPKRSVRPVLRKQSELPDGYLIRPSDLPGRVLLLDGFLYPDKAGLEEQQQQLDFEHSTDVVMPAQLAELIRVAAGTSLGTATHPTLIPELSAVRTNETKNGHGGRGRSWYMLPPLAKRHTPDLVIARVNNLHPRTILNSEPKVIVDANFSTVWMLDHAVVDAIALLACLNSSWVIAAMELTAAVLGGGALKLEATHLRRLPIPVLSTTQWSRLSLLGRQLTAGGNSQDTLKEIDTLIFRSIFGADGALQALQAVKRVAEQKLNDRKQK